MVNGVEYDHESLEMQLEGVGLAVSLTEVNYDAERDVDVVTDKNGVPRGLVRKGFQGTFDCSLARDQYDQLVEATKDTGVLGAEPRQVVMTYSNDGEEPTSDELEVKITKIGWSSQEGERVMVKLEGKQTRLPRSAGSDLYVPGGGR